MRNNDETNFFANAKVPTQAVCDNVEQSGNGKFWKSWYEGKCNSELCVAREEKEAREMYNYYQMGRMLLCFENNEIKDRGEVVLNERKLPTSLFKDLPYVFFDYHQFSLQSAALQNYKYYNKVTMDQKFYLFLFFLSGKKKSIQLPMYR
jgi:hypothetical protein